MAGSKRREKNSSGLPQTVVVTADGGAQTRAGAKASTQRQTRASKNGNGQPSKQQSGRGSNSGAAASQQAANAAPVQPLAVLGSAAGQTALMTKETTRPLSVGGGVLPELVEAEVKPRPAWKHPAFIVSMILTILAGLGAAAWFIVGLVTDEQVRVSSMTISVSSGNAHLDWSGPDAEYSLFAVQGSGEVLDLSQLIRGSEAWIPSALGFYDNDTCFVVRSTSETATVSLNAETLANQGGASACVNNADR
ncbi:hypothetical protein [Humidisolicoccus flavus]|uniref:hypothetical protein n=1 Tax=Humidisolicoccus flavus TaxID=3111414 RepID=UPI003244CACA